MGGGSPRGSCVSQWTPSEIDYPWHSVMECLRITCFGRDAGWCQSRRLLVVLKLFPFVVLLNFHVAKFIGVKDFSAFQAFNVFRVFLPGNNSYSWVFAGRCHLFSVGWDVVLFPQIVAAFLSFSNCNLLNFLQSGNGSGVCPRRQTGTGLKCGQKRSYTECGPKKSDIPCSN